LSLSAQSQPLEIDESIIRSALATSTPPGIADLHALNTTLDSSKNIPGVTGGIPKMYNIPDPFIQAQKAYMDIIATETMLANPEVTNAIVTAYPIAAPQLALLGTAMASAKPGLSSLQTEMIGIPGAQPGMNGSIGFSNIATNAGLGTSIEGANAALPAVPDVAGSFGSGACDFMSGIFDFLGGVGDAIGDAMSGITGAIGDALSGMSGVFDGLADVASAIAGGIGSAIAAAEAALATATDAIAGALSGITAAIGEAMAAINGVIEDVLAGIASGIEELVNFANSISLPSLTANPCAKEGMAKIASPAGTAALDVSTGGAFTDETRGGLTSVSGV